VRLVAGLIFLVGTTFGAVIAIGVTPAAAATAPAWATGQYWDAIQNVPFCDVVTVASGTLPLTSITVGATPSGFTNYSIQDVNLATGTAEVCGTDTNAPNSSTSPPNLAPVATNGGGSATDNIPVGTYGACSWTTGKGTTSVFDANQDLYQTGSQSAFGAAITNGETLGSTSNYATCTDAMVSENGSGETGGEGDAWTVNTANPMPAPSDSNPSAAQGDLASSNLFLGSGGCYGSVNILSKYSFTSFGSGTSLTTPTPWVNGGNCKYGSLGNNEAGGNTDAIASCPPTQSDVDAGLVSCSITASSGNDYNGSFNYTTDDLLYSGQPVPQQSTATLSASSATPGGTVSVTGGSNWWGSSDGAPNAGPYGDAQQGSYYQVSAPGVYIGTSRATAVPVVGSTVAIGADSYACTGAESATVGPNPCTFTAGSPSGSFQIPSGLAPGTYNIYIDESNTTPLPGNGPNDSYQTARGTSLGTAESVSSIVVGTAPSITSQNNTTFTAGSAGSFTVTTSGSPTPALTETGSLPTGVTFTDNGNGTATLAGTAPTGGSYPFTITASNGISPAASQSFTLTVDAAPTITSAAASVFSVGHAGTFNVTSTGNPKASLSESGSLPSGVSFTDNGNGTATLAGTPAAGSGGTYSFTINASNGISPAASQSFTLTVDAAPTITSAAATTFTAGTPGTFTVTSAGNPTASLSENGALPSGVTLTDNGNGTATLAGTPAAGTGGSYPITINASNGVTPAGSQSFTLTVDGAPTITSASATTFTVGSAGTFTVTSSANPTASLSESGALPTGVTFVDNGDGTGTLSGTPAPGTSGTYNFTVGASNGFSPAASQSFTLTVDVAPSITSASSTTFTVGSAGTFTVTSTGNPTATVSKTGSLPSGVTLTNNGDGTATLAGTPAPGMGGSYTFTIHATNGISPMASQSFTLTVDAAPAITSASATTFTVGSAGTFTVTSTANPTASLSESGALPTGVTFADNGDGTGTLSGIPGPGTSGTYDFTIGASNGISPDASQSFTLTVDVAPTITSGASATFATGEAGSFTVTSTGNPTPALTETGALPSGVTFTDNGDGTGTLGGTPARGTTGSYTFAIHATNGISPEASQSFTLTVDAAPVITSTASTSFAETISSSFTVTTTGSPTATLSETGALPSGVTFTDNGDGTATLAGTPAVGSTGTYDFTIDATNGISPDASQSFTLNVNSTLIPPAITSAADTTFEVGSDGSFTVTSTGIPTPSFTESGALPSGVAFSDNGDGTATLSGTPAAGTNGTYPLTITATNGVGSPATQSFSLTVDASPAITSKASKTFTVGHPCTFTVTSTGTPTPSLTENGPLPSGVTFVDNGNGTGTLAGTPAAGSAGTYDLSFDASNGLSPDGTQSFVLTVHAAPSITSANATTFTQGSAGTFTVMSTGNPTASLSQTGSLPSGVTFTDNGDGTATLAGTPTVNGSYPITITASNGVSPVANQSFTLTVDGAPTITSASSKTFTKGSAGTFTVTSTGTPTATVSESGVLPHGVTFTSNANGTATLAGTPTQGGIYPISFDASNGVGSDAVQSFTLTVHSAPSITSVAATTFTQGAAGTFTVTSTGTPTPALSEAGSLPAGVTLTDNGDGTATLSGTPTVNGIYPITITAANGIGTNATQSFTLTVDGAPTITSANSKVFAKGSAGTFTVTSTGTPTAGLMETGALPHGVTFTDNGNGTATLAGTPTQGGVYPIMITADNGVGSNASQSFTITVHAAPTITSASATTFNEGSAGTFTVTTSGTPTPSLSETGALPAGVIFTDNGNGTASLVGTPAANGIFPITVTAANGIGSNATQSFTLTVDAPPTITSSAGATFTEGISNSFVFTATGTPTPTNSESGALPPGVTFVHNVLSGTPTQTGTFPIRFTSTNAIGTATQSFTLSVGSVPKFTTGASTSFSIGSEGTFRVFVTGTPAPTITETGNLPGGVTFTNGVLLSGTPTQVGTFDIAFVARNGIGSGTVQNFTLTVLGLKITTTTLPKVTEGKKYSEQLTATGGLAPLTWTENGALPKGITFSSKGLISGTTVRLDKAGTYTFKVQVTDSTKGKVQTVTATFKLTVVS
jgi:hypothetical protein